MAGRARSVHQRPGIVVRKLGQFNVAITAIDRSLVGCVTAATSGFDPVWAGMRQGIRGFGIGRIEDQHLWRAITQDEIQFWCRKPPVQGQKDRAQLCAGRMHFHHVGRVHRQHGDAIAFRDATITGEMRGKAAAPILGLRIGERSR